MIGLLESVTEHLAEPAPSATRAALAYRAKQVVLATGAVERPLVFPGNDRPGIMLADAAHTYLRRYGVKVGTHVVIVTSNDCAYAAGTALRDAGVVIAAVADARADPSAVARASGLPLLLGTTVTTTEGHLRVKHVMLSNGERIACDAVLMSGGFAGRRPVHLYSQSRDRLRFDKQLDAFLPGEWTPHIRSAGACNGTRSTPAACVAEGHAAGEGSDRPIHHRVAATVVPRPNIAGREAFVDFQNDVTAKDLRAATREGFRSIEHIKFATPRRAWRRTRARPPI